MNQTRWLKSLIPFVMLFGLLGLLGKEIFFSHTREMPSALLGKPLPNLKLTNLYPPYQTLTEKNFPAKVFLINVWSSWCYACRLEQPTLLLIQQQYGTPIYGINYRDEDDDARAWLKNNGNPFTWVGTDKYGSAAIDLGVYGTPETFVVSPYGNIIYRHAGAINEHTWKEVIYPLIKKYES